MLPRKQNVWSTSIFFIFELKWYLWIFTREGSSLHYGWRDCKIAIFPNEDFSKLGELHLLVFKGPQGRAQTSALMAGRRDTSRMRSSIVKLGDCRSLSEQLQDHELKICVDSYALPWVFHEFLSTANVEDCIDSSSLSFPRPVASAMELWRNFL